MNHFWIFVWPTPRLAACFLVVVGREFCPKTSSRCWRPSILSRNTLLAQSGPNQACLRPGMRLNSPYTCAHLPPCVTFRLVVVSSRGPGRSPVLPFACCVGSLLSVGRCGRCSCSPPPPPAVCPTNLATPLEQFSLWPSLPHRCLRMQRFHPSGGCFPVLTPVGPAGRGPTVHCCSLWLCENEKYA